MRTWTFIGIFLMMMGYHLASAQELVQPAPYNPQKSEKILQEHLFTVKSTDLPLELPFLDDFSYPGPYPDHSLWADQYVFINTGFAFHPKTVGVATFDMLNEEGVIYEHIETGNIPYQADYLTSHPINLEPYQASDSLILSFYYQPQGRGGNPSRDELLVLQFLGSGNDSKSSRDEDNGNDDNDDGDDDNGDDDNGEEDLWQTVWSASGQSLSEFSQDTFPYFKRVSIPIVDEDFFRDDFQFRFMNYVAIPIGQWNNSGTRSIWNIDYVSLDRDRSVLDTTYNDIAFAAPAQTMLRDYTSMPWSQYMANPAEWHRDRLSMRITNLGGNTFNYNYRYFVRDESGTSIASYVGGSALIDPFFEAGYQDHGPHATPVVLPNPFSPLIPAAKRDFDVVHALRKIPDGDDFSRNDTIKYRQSFDNYFAFDNKSAESVHLLKGYNPERVLMFTTAHSDILEAIQIFFMETVENQDNERAFELVVYSSLNPETKLYSSEEVLFTPEEKGTFVTIPLEEPVEVSGTFYVGVRQVGNINLNTSLVIGFDRSNNVQHRLFIKDGIQADGNWYQSGFEGALMIRSVMGLNGATDIVNMSDTQQQIKLYPNPVGGNYVYVEIDWDINKVTYQVYDATGRLVSSGSGISRINVADLKNGLYILRVTNGKVIESTRFIISR